MEIQLETIKADEPLGGKKTVNVTPESLKLNKPKKKDPSFGCLKGGKKPTFKQWKQTPVEPTVKHFARFGKDAKNKTIRVHLNDASGYKKIKKGIEKLEKEPLSVVCKYLADRNLYKAGSAAPEDILRETYKNAYLTGNIENRDAEVMMHNFMHGQTDPA